MNPSSVDMSTKHFNMLINGEIASAKEEGYFESINPSNGEVTATVTNANLDDMTQAIKAAKDSFKGGIWRNFSLPERGVYLKKIAKLRKQKLHSKISFKI